VRFRLPASACGKEHGLREFLGDYVYFVAPFIAWFLCQLLKVVFYLFAERQLNIARLFDIGGMPSSHSALVVALATVLGLREGIASPLFGVALIFALVVMYDATNLRRATGEHAHTLNRVIPDLLRGKLVQNFDFRVMREVLGHTPMEVAVGSVIGFLLAYGMVLGLP